MSSYEGTVAILCAGIVFADVPSARPQDATSTNLPEHLETGEPAPPAKSKRKKAGRRREVAARAPTQTPTPASEQTPPAEEPVTAAPPMEKKARIRRRALPRCNVRWPAFRPQLSCRSPLPKPWQ